MNHIEKMKQAYLAGFMASGEGYNAEWPFGDKNQNPENDPAWCRKRDNTLRAAIAETEKQEPVAFLDWYDNAIWGNEDFKAGCWRAWDAALEHATPPAAQPAPVQEPVAWMVYTLDGTAAFVTLNPADFTDEHRALPLYTTPPAAQRQWVGLTDEERAEVYRSIPGSEFTVDGVSRAIEAKLREKNTPEQKGQP